MYPEERRSGGLRPAHFMMMSAVTVVGAIIAVVLFLSVVGFLFHLVEIAVVVIIIAAIIRWIVTRAGK
jgi:hypothetical protein